LFIIILTLVKERCFIMGEIVNLLVETVEVLREHGKSEEDVRWVGSKDGEFAITWDEFVKIADEEY